MDFAQLGQDFLEFLAIFWDMLVFSLTGTAMIAGWFGMLVPAFPAGVVMWVAALLTGLNFGFGVWGWIIFIIITILALILFVLDDMIFITQAKQEGLPLWLIGLSMFLALIFTFFFTPIVGLLTPPVLLFFYEYIKEREFDRAWLVFKKIFKGMGITLLYRFGVGFLILLLWGLWLVIVI